MHDTASKSAKENKPTYSKYHDICNRNPIASLYAANHIQHKHQTPGEILTMETTFQYNPDRFILTHDEQPTKTNEYEHYKNVFRNTASQDDIKFFGTALVKAGYELPKNKHGLRFNAEIVRKNRLFRNPVKLRTISFSPYYRNGEFCELYHEQTQTLRNLIQPYNLTHRQKIEAMFEMMDVTKRIYDEPGIAGLAWSPILNTALGTLLTKYSERTSPYTISGTHPELCQTLQEMAASYPTHNFTELANIQIERGNPT